MTDIFRAQGGAVAYVPHAGLLAFDPNRTLLPEITGITRNAAAADCCIGWGHKRLGRRARRRAEQYGKPYWALEDAFLRSVGLGKNGAAPIGISLDKTGVYYDCFSPCDLEERLGAAFSAEEEARGAALATRIVSLGCTKYNTDVDPLPKAMHGGKHVIIVDQTAGDASVSGAGGGEESFRAMLAAAREEYPDATLWIKTHPDVLAGKARGYLLRLCEGQGGFSLLSGNPPAYRLAQAAAAVFTVSSQFGFEALLAGAEVHCFAYPFYAGWGLTVDRAPPPLGLAQRRGARPNVAMLAHAAFIDHARYRDPFRDALIEAEDAADLLYDIKTRYLARKKNLHCVGFSGWKQPFVRKTIGTPFSPMRFYLSVKHACYAARREGGDVAVWAGREKGAIKRALAAHAGDLRVFRVEDGFIRSAGLGAALLPGCSLACDGTGAHFDASRPSDLEYLLNTHQFSAQESERAALLFERLARESVTKYGVAEKGARYLRPAGKSNVHLIVGQVADDASLRATPVGGISSNDALIAEVARLYGGDTLLYRPHPDVTAGYRKGAISPETLAALGIEDARGYALGSLLREVDHVHAISSLVGMEALYYGKRVHVYGGPFYAGWGLTRDRLSFPRRSRALQTEELIYIAMALYPYYVDPVSQYPCDIEIALNRRAAGEYGKPLKLWESYRWMRYISGWRNYRAQQ